MIVSQMQASNDTLELELAGAGKPITIHDKPMDKKLTLNELAVANKASSEFENKVRNNIKMRLPSMMELETEREIQDGLKSISENLLISSLNNQLMQNLETEAMMQSEYSHRRLENAPSSQHDFNT